MTETEKAIAAIEEAIEEPSLVYCRMNFYPVVEPAAKAALSALRAQQEREKGCEYCRDGKCMKTGSDYHCETTCNKCQYNLSDKKFCPHCGRPLAEH